MAEDKQAVIEAVMNKIEDFYFSDAEDSGEMIFNKWAEQYADQFPDDMDAEGCEQKLEYTPSFNEFCKLFESKIEGKCATLLRVTACRADSELRRRCRGFLRGP